MLITSNIIVFRAGCSSTSNDAAANPMIRNKNPFNLIQPAFVSSFIILGIVVLCGPGCASSRKLGSERVAAVIIKDASPETIKTSAKEVFEKQGFESAPEDDNELIFQKKASVMHAFLYADWYSGTVWARAKLYLQERKAGETLLD